MTVREQEPKDNGTIVQIGGELPIVSLEHPDRVEDHKEASDGDESTNLPDEHQLP